MNVSINETACLGFQSIGKCWLRFAGRLNIVMSVKHHACDSHYMYHILFHFFIKENSLLIKKITEALKMLHGLGVKVFD